MERRQKEDTKKIKYKTGSLTPWGGRNKGLWDCLPPLEGAGLRLEPGQRRRHTPSSI